MEHKLNFTNNFLSKTLSLRYYSAYKQCGNIHEEFFMCFMVGLLSLMCFPVSPSWYWSHVFSAH